MNKYRKSDQHYIDEYDRRTIHLLKELENKEASKRGKAKSIEEKRRIMIEEYASFDSFYHNAVMRARGRADFIQASIQRDEGYDRLVEKYSKPQNINCKTCNAPMFVCSHFFKEGPAKILFVFECPEGHSPRRAFYPNGNEYHFPQRRCEKCKGELHLAKKETVTKLIFIETCEKCKLEKVQEIAIPADDETINEEERRKYCTAYMNRDTFEEDLKVVADLAKSLAEQRKRKQEKEEYNFDAVQRIKIPQLEHRLSQVTEKEGFAKFSFEKPVFTSHTTIVFSVQDPTDRNEKESAKCLLKALHSDLFETNWRLVKSELTYRMGYLTGKVKGFEQDKDLMKIAKEIHEKKKSN